MLKDDFNSDVSQWTSVRGGTITLPCQELVEGSALVFDSLGLRQAQTQDLDLRDARSAFEIIVKVFSFIV